MRLIKKEQRVGPLKRHVIVDADTGLFAGDKSPRAARFLNAVVRFGRLVAGTTRDPREQE